jgi:predicted RNase H-like HicB family nuclease
MAAVTVVITQNADGSLTGSSTSTPGGSFTTNSLQAVMDWAKGVVEVTLGSLLYPSVTS